MRTLPHELFNPPLRLQPFPTLMLELVEQQLEALVLIVQWLKAPFSELFGPARARRAPTAATRLTTPRAPRVRNGSSSESLSTNIVSSREKPDQRHLSLHEPTSVSLE
jgi:hypothetical protein